jgi:hypothetical protein
LLLSRVANGCFPSFPLLTHSNVRCAAGLEKQPFPRRASVNDDMHQHFPARIKKHAGPKTGVFRFITGY